MNRLIAALCIVTVMATGAAVPVYGSPAAVNLRKGELFLKARPRVIAQGWKPVRMHVSDQWEYTGLDRAFFDRKVYELDSCTVDISLCIFYYRKDGRCLRVNTRGETIATNKVTGWQVECPPPETPNQKFIGMRTVSDTSGVSRVTPTPTDTFKLRASANRYE